MTFERQITTTGSGASVYAVYALAAYATDTANGAANDGTKAAVAAADNASFVLTASPAVAKPGDAVSVSITPEVVMPEYVAIFDHTSHELLRTCYRSATCTAYYRSDYDADVNFIAYGVDNLPWPSGDEAQYAGAPLMSNVMPVRWTSAMVTSADVTLTALPPATANGATATLVAASNVSAPYLLIYDVGSGDAVATCWTSPCTADVSANSATTRTYVAVASEDWGGYFPPAGEVGRSDVVTVQWADVPPPPPVVTLTAAPPVTTAGSTATLAAAANVGSWIEIFDVDRGILVDRCPSQNCTASVTENAAVSRAYVAYATLTPQYAYPPADVVASSGRTTVEWKAVAVVAPPSGTRPSDRCAGGLQVTDTTVEGVHVKAYVLARTSTETDVCVRAEDATTGAGSGGELVLTATSATPGLPSLGVPSTDSQSGACATTAGNLVPGQHPAVASSVAGTAVVLDAYASGTAGWLCVAGAGVNTRVLVPVVIPSIGPTPTVTLALYLD